jgi:multisubunit Na+/H+ antiporter MnhE subunit
LARQNKTTGPLAVEPGQRPGGQRHRGATWLAWWTVMMSLWVMVDDSVAFDELLAGAGAAALAALTAEAVSYQAGIRLRVRGRWLLTAELLRLPGQVAADTVTIFAALARALARGKPPHGEFTEIPVRYGDDAPPGVTRRVLLTGARSLAPNTFVVGLDQDRDVMVVHKLVAHGPVTGP